MSEPLQLCTFEVDRLFLGLEVLRVKEVLRAQDMTAVPRADPVIRGLINLRGQIVTALDVRRRFGLPHLAADQKSMNVVVRARGGAVSLLVDRIGDVVEVAGDAQQPAPGTLDEAVAPLVRGVFRVDGRLLMLLDLDRLISVPTQAPGAGLVSR